VIGGLLCAVITRIIFDLPAFGGSPLGLGISAVAGAFVLFLTTQLMAQSPPQVSKRAVIIFLFVASAVLGVIASSAILLVVKFASSDFFQGISFVRTVITVLICGAVAAILFLIAAAIRGFEMERAPVAAAKPSTKTAIKINQAAIQKLSNRKS
jgi:peptidoglycan biosynthesis protein MviN/MurJ (putative lipid II flippase)